MSNCLREAIMRGYFSPGERLREPAIAQALGVSRGPIREALVELEREGLVQIQRRRGATVTRLTETDIEEIYRLRVALERLAMQCAVEVAAVEDLAAMDTIVAKLERAVKRGAMQEVIDLDIEFHDSIYRAARNSRLYTCWSSLRSQTRAFLLSSTIQNGAVQNADYLKIVVPEHSVLRDVLETRDKGRAVELIEEHLQGAYKRLALSQFGAVQRSQPRELSSKDYTQHANVTPRRV